MVTLRACRMPNATASTVAVPRPYRAPAELQSDNCIKLDGVPARNEYATEGRP